MSVRVGLLVASSSPSPTPVEVPLAEQASPGLVGFLVTFAIAVAAVGLFRSLTRHLRVVERKAAQVAAEDAAVVVARAAADVAPPDEGLRGGDGPTADTT